jgi:tetratricopeptide (TPR) repeat protein
MKYKIFVVGLIFIFIQTAIAQSVVEKALPTPTPKLSVIVSNNIIQQQQQQSEMDVSRERREQALAKLLEGQRYIWSLRNLRSNSATANAARLARQLLQEAIKLDPNLAEAYTALAEMTWMTSPGELDEPIRLAGVAVRLNPDNFGARHWLAWFYTLKSGIGDGNLSFNQAEAEKAVAAWKEISRLDPRNAEAFAFLSEFYDRAGKKEEQIAALKKWLASANAVNPRFYMKIMGTQDDLSPENASLKLGKALIDAGRHSEAVEYLNRAIADNPQSSEAVDLLREAIESSDPKQSANSIEALQQAVFANPENTSLVILLAQTQARNGKLDAAAKLLRNSIAKTDQNKFATAAIQMALGDIYAEAEHFDEAVLAYREALKSRGVENKLVTDDDRNFASIVYDKIVQTYKNANRLDEAKNTIEATRELFGKDDFFTDKQLIALFRETGKKQEALQAVRAVRSRFADDYSLLRLEASLLAENGKVDEGAALIKSLINKQNSANLSPLYDDFSNYVFISSLYSESKRGKEAIETANQAYSAAKTDDQRQIAKLLLATAQQMSGDHKSAEDTLRGLLKQSPRNPIALNNLGYFLLERNERFVEALNLIQQAVNIDPTNPSYLDSLGWAYYKLEKFEEAERHLKNAARLAISSATIYEHLGDVYHKQKRSDLAKIVWQKALNLASDAEMSRRIKAKLGK